MARKAFGRPWHKGHCWWQGSTCSALLRIWCLPGEMLGPAVIGVLFGWGHYSAIGEMIALLQFCVLLVASTAYRVATRQKVAV